MTKAIRPKTTTAARLNAVAKNLSTEVIVAKIIAHAEQKAGAGLQLGVMYFLPKNMAERRVELIVRELTKPEHGFGVDVVNGLERGPLLHVFWDPAEIASLKYR